MRVTITNPKMFINGLPAAFKQLKNGQVNFFDFDFDTQYPNLNGHFVLMTQAEASRIYEKK